MNKKIYLLVSILLSINIFGSSNSEINSVISPIGGGEDFSWKPVNIEDKDMTNKISYKNPEVQKNSLKLLSKSVSGKYVEEKFILEEPMPVSIIATSKRGAKISLIDRMAGVIETSGLVGSSDGRIDKFLDAGEYKIIAESDEKGPLKLDVQSFNNVNKKEDRNFFLNSNPGEYLQTTLKDMEQRDYWIYIEKDKPLIMEIMGRNLKYCSIWKDGKWKINSNFMSFTREVTEGQPMNFFEFNSILPEGYYLIKCIGGIKSPWSTESSGEKHPFYIRKGSEVINRGELKPVKVSPFGYDAYFYKNADMFIASPKDKTDLSLTSSPYTSGRSRFRNGDSKSITEEDDICVLNTGYSRDTFKSIIVSAPAGTELNLGAFRSSNSPSININSSSYGTKRYWINGLIPEAGISKMDMTPILADSNKWIKRAGFININKAEPFSRKNNLFSHASYFIQIEEKVTLCIEELGDKTNAKAEFSFTNFRDFNEYDYYPEKYKTGDTVTLKSGFYILELDPIKKGIHHFAIFPRPFGIFTTTKAKEKAKEFETIYPGGDLTSFNWSETSLTHSKSSRFQLLINSQSSRIINVRELPLTLEEDFLTLVLSPEESVQLEIKVDNNSRLKVKGRDYKTLDINSKPVGLMKYGIHKITLVNTGSKRQIYSIGTEELISNSKIEEPIQKSLSELLPILSADKPVFSNYDRYETKQFLLKVTEPGLYRLETSGRLRMSLKVRTPNITSLFDESENGIGRNALINTFLKPGYYLVESSAIGKSRGRAGLLLNKNPLTNGETLYNGSVSRREVKAGEAVKYPVKITEEGDYLFSTLLLGSQSNLRLEDNDGWPIYISGSPTRDFRTDLSPGEYAYYSLPGKSDSRRVTALDKQQKAEVAGIMPLNGEVHSVWQENGNRIPDKYNFSISANHTGSITIPEGFEAWISGVEGNELFRSDKRILNYELNKGRYSFNIRTIEIDNNKRYTFYTHTKEFSADTERELNYPGNHILSIGKDSLVDIWSMGKKDVKAKLFKGETLLASSDDEPGDWNFFISQKLKKGKYTLNITSNNSESGRTPVFVRERGSIDKAPVNLPYSEEFRLDDRVLSIPIKMGRTAATVSVKINSKTDSYIGVYNGDKKIAQGIGSIYIPLKGENYSIKIFHRSPETINLKINIETPQSVTTDFRNILDINTASAVLINKNELNYYIEAGENVIYSPGLEIPLKPLESYSQTTFNQKGFLVNTDGILGEVKTRELKLKTGKGEAVNIEKTPLRFKFTNQTDKLTLIKAVSPGSTLGLMLDGGSNSVSWNDSAITDNYTVMPIIKPGDYTGRLWNPESRRVKGALVSSSFNIENTMNISEREILEINPGSALVLNSSRESNSYEVVISRGLVAAVWRKGLPERTYDATNGDVIFNVSPGDYQIGLINYSLNGGLIRIRPGSVSEAYYKVDKKNYFESYRSKGGTIELDIEDINDKFQLHFSGNITSAEFKDDSGKYISYTIKDNDNITTLNTGNGTLKLNYTKGLLRVWVSPTEERDVHYATGKQSVGLRELEPGKNNLKGKVSGWKLITDKPGFLKLSTGSGGVTTLLKDNKILETSYGLYPEGRDLYYYLKSGEYQIYSRPFNGDKQSGDIIYSFSEATELTEGGLENELFITDGEKHIYTFIVANPGKVGVGVETDKDYLDVKLYNGDFSKLDSGSLLFRDMQEGRYFIIVTSKEKTVRYRPVVYGLSGSRQDIPEDVIKKYK